MQTVYYVDRCIVAWKWNWIWNGRLKSWFLMFLHKIILFYSFFWCCYSCSCFMCMSEIVATIFHCKLYDLEITVQSVSVLYAAEGVIEKQKLKFHDHKKKVIGSYVCAKWEIFIVFLLPFRRFIFNSFQFLSFFLYFICVHKKHWKLTSPLWNH